ncbi:TonB-dependent receptor [Paralcaligenes ginsengisoli]
MPHPVSHAHQADSQTCRKSPPVITLRRSRPGGAIQGTLGAALLLGAAVSPGLLYAQTIAAPAPTLETITVSGTRSVSKPTPPAYAGGEVASGGQAGILGNLDNMDMPFTQTSYTSKLIQDQQARTLGDVLKNDASVQVGNGYGNQAETFVIRGFPLNNDDLSFNGLYGILPRQVLPVEMVERVEVFKGASAFLNGAAPGGSGLGGIINIQPKRAADTPLTRLNLDYTGRGQFGGGVDIGRRWGDDNRFGIRVNAAHRDGDTSVPGAGMRSTVGTIGLDYRGDQLRVSLDAGYQKIHFDHPRPTINISGAVPDAPSNSINYGQPWAYSDLESTFAVTRLEYDLNSNWTSYAAVGVSRDKESGDYSAPTVDGQGIGTRGLLSVPFQRDTFTGEIGLRGQFRTGPIGHRVNLAYSALNKTERTAFEYISADPANIYEEMNVPRPVGVVTGNMDDPNVSQRLQLRSVAVSDTLSFFHGDVLLTLGARNQSLVSNSYDVATRAQTSRYDKSITTPVVGLVVRPWDTVSLYANHIEGLSQGDIAGATAVNANEALAPYRTKQNEAGIKVDLGNYGGSLGVFQIEKPVAYLDPATNIFGPSGEQRNRGVELNVYGEPLRGWRVLGGVTFMDPRLTKTSGGANDDNYAPGVPRFQGVISTEWDLRGVPGLTLQASLLHHGSEYTSATNAYKIPSWTRLDLGARYATKVNGHNVVWRAGVENVANRAYWASIAPQFGQITQGEGRTVKLSMSADF